MKKSDNIEKLTECLAKARAAFSVIAKTKTAKIKGKTADGKHYEYEYKYADLPTIHDATIKHLSENGLALIQGESDDGKRILTLLIHSSGQWIETDLALIVEGKYMQDRGAAISYTRRIALNATLNISSEDDPDNKPKDKQTTNKEKEIIPFGPTKGKKFSQVTMPELQKTYDWALKNKKFPEFQEEFLFYVQKLEASNANN